MCAGGPAPLGKQLAMLFVGWWERHYAGTGHTKLGDAYRVISLFFLLPMDTFVTAVPRGRDERSDRITRFQ